MIIIATSSFTKNFVIKDAEVAKRFLEDIETVSEPIIKNNDDKLDETIHGLPLFDYGTAAIYAANSERKLTNMTTHKWENFLTNNIKGEDNMNKKGLYSVILVNKEDIVLNVKVIATSEEEAKYKAGVYEELNKLSISLQDANIYVDRIMTLKD